MIDISHLRSAYQQDVVKAEASAEKRLPRTDLLLGLDDIASGKDTIPSFALYETMTEQQKLGSIGLVLLQNFMEPAGRFGMAAFGK